MSGAITHVRMARSDRNQCAAFSRNIRSPCSCAAKFTSLCKIVTGDYFRRLQIIAGPCVLRKSYPLKMPTAETMS